MATPFSILAWEIPWTEEPGRLQSMGHTVRHEVATEQQQTKLYGKWAYKTQSCQNGMMLFPNMSNQNFTLIRG